MMPVIRRPFKTRSTEEVMALLSAVATAILAVIIIAMLYFGREIFVPIALAILLSFVLAPLVVILQRNPCAARVGGRERGHPCLRQPIFAMGSLLATQLTQARRRSPALSIDDKRKASSLFGRQKAGRGTLEQAPPTC